MKKLFVLISSGLLFLLGSARSTTAAEIKVFAAASLTDVLQALAKDYEPGGDQIVFNFAGSNMLARQIMQGAPADLFVSADEAQMDAIAKAGLLVEGSRRDILSNTLAVVVSKENPLHVLEPADLAKADFKRIVLADPRLVPAGVYAKAYLEKIGIWKAVQEKIIPTDNVRAALAAVEAGNADAGIVYKTDALISKKIRIVHEVPSADGPRILYPLALIKGSAEATAAEKFLNYLESPTAAKLFVQYGFSVVNK